MQTQAIVQITSTIYSAGLLLLVILSLYTAIVHIRRKSILGYILLASTIISVSLYFLGEHEVLGPGTQGGFNNLSALFSVITLILLLPLGVKSGKVIIWIGVPLVLLAMIVSAFIGLAHTPIG